jgi:hypothetical protein
MIRVARGFALAALVIVADCGKAPPAADSARMMPAERATAAAAASPDAPWAVSMRGIGPLMTGAARRALPASAGIAARADGATPAAGQAVRVTRRSLAGAVSVMLLRDTIVRVDVDSAGVATTWGDQVGDAEGDVLRRHAGHVRTEPHKYTGPVGHYLIVTDSTDSAHALVFETDGQHVTRYRAGRRPEVEWVEGCG